MYPPRLVPSVKRLALSIGVIMAFSMGTPVQAATIVWQTPVTISAGSDVSTNGTQVFGRNIAVSHPSPTAVVNGANFGYNDPNWTVSFNEAGGANTAAVSPPAFGGPDASNYGAILANERNGSGAGAGGALTLTFGNLTVGRIMNCNSGSPITLPLPTIAPKPSAPRVIPISTPRPWPSWTRMVRFTANL